MDSTKTLMLAAGALATITTAAHATDAISADDARAIVAEMLADADSRSSLIQGGHANSEMKIGGYTQIRYTLNFTDDDSPSSDFESGFSIPRTDLAFSGTVHDTISYKVGGRFDGTDNSGDFELRDAYVRWNWDNGWGLQLGQYKLPVWREDFISSSRQLAVERSVTDDVFSPSRSQNIHLDYRNDNVTWYIAFSDGYRSANTDFDEDATSALFSGGETDYAFTSRLDIKLAGDWNQFREFTSAPGSETASVLGLAIHWEGGEFDENAAANADQSYDGLAWVVDFMFKGDGWNLFAGYVGAFTEIDGADNDFTDHGFVVQGGFYIPDTNWELFGRYDVVIADGDRTNDDAFNTLTFGTNHYLHGHAAKFTFDVVWFLDATTDSDVVNGVVGRDTSLAILPSAEDDQFAIRGQFQLAF